MTWFQLVAENEPEPCPPERLVPNSAAFFLNPVAPTQPQMDPEPFRTRPQLYLVR